MTIQEQIQDIRGQLRLFMNGVVSASMRKKGLDYKLNFGIELPRIKEIAANYQPSVALAEALWIEQTRELKILATLLYPREQFNTESAIHWVEQVNNIEIARLLVMNQLQHLEEVKPLCLRWIASSEEMTQVVGFLTIARLLAKEEAMDGRAGDEFTNQALSAALSGDFSLKDAAVQSLKNFMQLNDNNKFIVLALVEPYADSTNENAKLLYEIIQEEASYL